MKYVIVITSLLMTACGFEVVDTGSRGIETRFGEVIGEPLPEGLHFYNPFTSDITEVSVREEKFESKTDIFTKDNQNTSITFTATWRIDTSKVGVLYKTVGREEAITEIVLKPTVLGSMKDAIGQIDAEYLISKREAATDASLETIKRNLSDRGIIMVDLQFTNIDFDDAFERAVEEKVVATQSALKAKNDTVRIEEEAKQTVMAAKAQAESMRIQSEALSKNQNLVQYELAKKWDGKLPQYMMGNTTPMIDMRSLGK